MGEKVLIVDDEAELRELLKDTLEEAGFEVLTAENGAVALEVVNKTNVHIIFSDLQMPVMDGLDLCRQIKKIRPVSLIYAMTGFASIYDLVACREAGFDDYFVKPINLSIVINTAENAVDKLNRWRRK